MLVSIGNGQVAHNLSGKLVIQSLDSWVSLFKGFAWRWRKGKTLYYNKKINGKEIFPLPF